MADIGSRPVVGEVAEVEVGLGTICVPLMFLMLEDLRRQFIIGMPALEALGVWLATAKETQPPRRHHQDDDTACAREWQGKNMTGGFPEYGRIEHVVRRPPYHR